MIYITEDKNQFRLKYEKKKDEQLLPELLLQDLSEISCVGGQ